MQAENLFNQALEIHRQGELNSAQSLYLEVLQSDPMHADSHHNLGVIAIVNGQEETALFHFGIAFLAAPNNVLFQQSYARAYARVSDQHLALQREEQKCLSENDRRTIETYFSANEYQNERQEIVFETGNAANDNSKKMLHPPLVQAIESTLICVKTEKQLELILVLAKTYEKNGVPLAGIWKFAANRLKLNKYSFLEAAGRAIAIDPSDQSARNLYFEGLIIENRLEEAYALFRSQLSSNAQNNESLYDLANRFAALGQFDYAIELYRHYLKFDPTNAKAECNLGSCLQSKGLFQVAQQHYQNAIALDANLSSAHHNLGLCFKAKGDFSASLDALRVCLQLLIQNCYTLGTSHMTTNEAQRNARINVRDKAVLALQSIRTRLDEAGISFCIFAGCALGIFRDGDLMTHDKDLDLAVSSSIDREILIKTITRDQAFRINYLYHDAAEREHQFSLTAVHETTGIAIDIFFLHIENHHSFLVGPYHPKQSLLCRLDRFEFDAIEWRNQMWNLPSNTERYLSQVYGTDWRTPDPYFDTILSNPSRIIEALPPVLCYAYSKLCFLIQDRQWPACHAFLRQIRNRHQDPILIEFEEFIAMYE